MDLRSIEDSLSCIFLCELLEYKHQLRRTRFLKTMIVHWVRQRICRVWGGKTLQPNLLILIGSAHVFGPANQQKINGKTMFYHGFSSFMNGSAGSSVISWAFFLRKQANTTTQSQKATVEFKKRNEQMQTQHIKQTENKHNRHTHTSNANTGFCFMFAFLY